MLSIDEDAMVDLLTSPSIVEVSDSEAASRVNLLVLSKITGNNSLGREGNNELTSSINENKSKSLLKLDSAEKSVPVLRNSNMNPVLKNSVLETDPSCNNVEALVA